MCDFCGKGSLGPRKSARLIASNRQDIEINNLQLLRLGMVLINDIKSGKAFPMNFPELKFIPAPNFPHIIEWLFVVHILSFGFCMEPYRKKWTCQNNGGYLGICVAVSKAYKAGIDILNPRLYSTMQLRALHEVLVGDNNVRIPLLNERLKALHDAGKVLTTRFQGSFKNCVIEAKHSAIQLVNLLANTFEYFHDKARCNGREVVFHSKAQLLVTSIWVYYKNRGWGHFYDIDQFAVTSSPFQMQQVFLFYGVFEYSNHLTNLVKTYPYLENKCREEVEIRGCVLYVIEQLKNMIQEHIKDFYYLNPLVISSLLSRLWKETPHKPQTLFFLSKSTNY